MPNENVRCGGGEGVEHLGATFWVEILPNQGKQFQPTSATIPRVELIKGESGCQSATMMAQKKGGTSLGS